MALAVSEFQLLLVQLAADLGIKLGRLLAGMDRLDKPEALAFITDAYPQLAMGYLAASGELSVQFYNEQPTVSDFVAEPIDLLSEERLAASGRWAILQNNPTQALTGSAARAVMDQSRETILNNVEAEDGAKWARHASANACGFCRMLSTRRDVYLSGSTASFLAHDSCHCIAVMVRPGDTYEPAPYVEQWERDYIQARDDGATTAGEIAAAMDKAAGRRRDRGKAPEPAGGGSGGNRIPPNRMVPAGMDLPDDYPPMDDGSSVPFTPRNRPRPTDEDRERVLSKHRHGAGVPRKTEFPASWSDDDIMDAIDLTVAAPDTTPYRRGDKITFEKVVEGVVVKVYVRTDPPRPRFWSGFPAGDRMRP